MIKKQLDKFKKMSKGKKFLTVAVVAVLVFGIIRTKESGEEKIEYKLEKVSRSEVVSTVSETGEITASGKVDINSTIVGMVEEVYVRNGDIVKSGQNLFKVKSNASDIQRAEAYSAYMSAKTGLENAKANLYTLQAKMFGEWDEFVENAQKDEYDDSHVENRNLPEYHIPEKEWLAAEANYKNQQQVVVETQAGLNKAWLKYQAVTSGTVKAPMAGTVVNLAVNMGQEVSTDKTSLMIKNDGDTWVKLAVAETDVPKIMSGQKVVVSIDAIRGLEIGGTVDRVDEIGMETSGVVTYNVYVKLEATTEKSIRAGMTVQVDIETERVSDVPAISNSAIKTYQGVKSVQIVDEKTGELLYKPVKIGVEGDSKTEIVSGLSEGEEVVIGQISTNSQESSKSGFMSLPGRH